MLPCTFSVSRNLTLFYYVSTPSRVLCMLVGVAFRVIGRLLPTRRKHARAFFCPSPVAFGNYHASAHI